MEEEEACRRAVARVRVTGDGIEDRGRAEKTDRAVLVYSCLVAMVVKVTGKEKRREGAMAGD